MTESTPPAERKAAAKRHSTLRSASFLAAAHHENTKPKDVTHYVKITKAKLEFKMMCLQAEMNLMAELSNMPDGEKLDALFFLIDKDHDGVISAVELSDGLRKVRGDESFEESMALAVDRSFASLDKKDGDTKLNGEEFQVYVDSLCKTLGCSFHELSEMLVMQVVFADGNNAIEDLIDAVAEEKIEEAVREEGEYRKVFVDTRMRVLFDIFDVDHDGEIDFKEVVLGMYKITEDIDGASHAAVNALIMFDTDETRTLNYEKFCRFIINVVHASSNSMTFNDIADAITRAANSDIKLTPEEMTHLFAMDSTVKSVLHMKHASAEDLEKVKSSAKIDRLFRLWDTDNSGYLDFQELALGLRKFEETTSLVKTVEETTKIMTNFDTNADQKLDAREFALFIDEFTKTCGVVDVHDMIDFMIVTSALKENSEQERRYIQSLGSGNVVAGYWD